jgi:hypothetical protein
MVDKRTGKRVSRIRLEERSAHLNPLQG